LARTLTAYRADAVSAARADTLNAAYTADPRRFYDQRPGPPKMPTTARRRRAWGEGRRGESSRPGHEGQIVVSIITVIETRTADPVPIRAVGGGAGAGEGS